MFVSLSRLTTSISPFQGAFTLSNIIVGLWTCSVWFFSEVVWPPGPERIMWASNVTTTFLLEEGVKPFIVVVFCCWRWENSDKKDRFHRPRFHSFIHIEHLGYRPSGASSRELLGGAPDSCTAKKSSLKVRKNAGDKALGKSEFEQQQHLEQSFTHSSQAFI